MKRMLLWIGAIFVLGLFFIIFSPKTPILPNSSLTPGDINPSLTKEVICAENFDTHDHRSVSAATKLQVYRLYGLKGPYDGYCKTPHGCEVDHLLAIEDGGSNSIKNLWIQPYEGIEWNAYKKDHLENVIHKKICSGEIDMQVAQQELMKNWIEAYKKYIK